MLTQVKVLILSLQLFVEQPVSLIGTLVAFSVHQTEPEQYLSVIYNPLTLSIDVSVLKKR